MSGGGARGIAHIGVIEEMERRGYEIASITGTSMGALVGGVHAMGKLEEFKNWLYALDKLKAISLVDFTFSSKGLIKGDKILNAMREFIPDELIENLPIPYSAVAVDILSMREVVFTKGSLYKAMRASIAIPTLFTPVREGRSLFVDGGVLNNLPIQHATRIHGDSLVAVNVCAGSPPGESMQLPNDAGSELQGQVASRSKSLPHSEKEELNFGYFDLINRVVAMMTQRIVLDTIERYPPDLLINIPRDSCGILDFFRAEEMVEIGRQIASESLA